MKQYTNESQIAKLIELGLTQPRTKIPFEVGNYELGYTYSIGELIEMLPKEIRDGGLLNSLSIYIDHNKMWVVEYNNALGELLSTCRTELIDALYDMIVKLKEEGVI